MEYRPTRPASFEAEIGDLPRRAFLHPVTLDWTERSSEALIDIGISVVGNDFASPGNQVHQSLESRLHRVQVGINIGVVKLNGRKNHGLGEIVQKLRAFVEEGGIVFVAFQDEMLSLAQGETAPKIF